MRSLAIHSLLIGAALGIALPRGDNGCLRGRGASANGVVAHDCNVNARSEAPNISPDTAEKNKRAASRVEFVTLHPSVTVRVNGSRPVTEPKPAPGEQKNPTSAPVKVTQPIQPPALKQPSSIPSSVAGGAQPFRTLTPLPNSPPLGKAPPIQPPAGESKTIPQPSLIALPPQGSPPQGSPQPPSAVKPKPDQKLPPVAPSKPSLAPPLPIAPSKNTGPLIQPTGASGGVGVILVPLPANHRPTTTFSIDPLTSAASIPVQASQKSASSRLPESPISAPPAQKQPPPPPPPASVPTSVSKALPPPPPPVKETSSSLAQPPPAKETSSAPVQPPAKETPSAPVEPPPAKVSSSTSSSKEAAKPSKPAETSAQSSERATSREPSPTPTPTSSSSSSEEPKSSRRPKNTTTIFTAITPSKVRTSATETSAEAGASSTESAANSTAEGASTSSLTTASPTRASNITLSQTSLDRSGPTAIQSLTFHSAIDLGPARPTGTKSGLAATTTSVVFASPMIMSLDLTKYTLVSQLQLGALGAPANPTPV
ncbi:hypothetical protein VHEMI04822 [[Torrubiella] hemipterigena]|uniref:Uncharacterized protein n=1 Tax=[Torrubiella] hemipterigena TaxID=1531966 RepID=A0A0A1T2B6_9HYPO|nr:hypothetical protein VHEMI04822 [[Torrubiella] hemipterigena]